MNTASLFFLSQATTEDRVDYWVKTIPALLDRVGFPVIIVGLISWFFVMLFKWVAPKIDAWIVASIHAREAMAESYKETTKIVSKLSEETQNIQRENHQTLIEIKNGLLQVCKHSRCSMTADGSCGPTAKDSNR